MYLGGNTNLAKISTLSNLTRLEELDLSRTKISNINPLKKLTNLKKLDLNFLDEISYTDYLAIYEYLKLNK